MHARTVSQPIRLHTKLDFETHCYNMYCFLGTGTGREAEIWIRRRVGSRTVAAVRRQRCRAAASPECKRLAAYWHWIRGAALLLTRILGYAPRSTRPASGEVAQGPPVIVRQIGVRVEDHRRSRALEAQHVGLEVLPGGMDRSCVGNRPE